MNRGEFVAELDSLGHGYVTVARRQRFVDWAARRVTHQEHWPERLVTEKLAGLDAGLVGQVDDVTAPGRRLGSTTRSELAGSGRTLSEPGVPQCYYFDGSVLKVWPVGIDVDVTHFSRGVWVSGGARMLQASSNEDVPVLPSDFDDLIVMEARIHCLEDTDEDGLRDAISERIVVEWNRMKDLHLNLNADEPGEIERRVGAST